MHVHIFTLVLLEAELGLFEGRLEDVATVVLYGVLGDYLDGVLLAVLILELFSLIVKVLPNDITRLLLLRCLQPLLSFDDRQLLFLQCSLLLDEAEHILGPILDHDGEIIHPVLSDSLLFRVVLHGQHLTDDGLLQDLDGFQTRTDLLQPTTLHLL
jgi:hypothetical protein